MLGLQGSTEANISQAECQTPMSGEPGQFIRVVRQIDFENDVQRTIGDVALDFHLVRIY